MDKKVGLIGAVAATVALTAALAACAPQANNPVTDEAAMNAVPAQDQFGVVVAEQWQGLYPNQYRTWLDNEANSPESGKDNYLETYPQLATMYKGYGFAKGYDEAASHSYTLRSIAETPRVNEKTLANCITCKTPQYTAMVQAEGDFPEESKFLRNLFYTTATTATATIPLSRK